MILPLPDEPPLAPAEKRHVEVLGDDGLWRRLTEPMVLGRIYTLRTVGVIPARSDYWNGYR